MAKYNTDTEGLDALVRAIEIVENKPIQSVSVPRTTSVLADAEDDRKLLGEDGKPVCVEVGTMAGNPKIAVHARNDTHQSSRLIFSFSARHLPQSKLRTLVSYEMVVFLPQYTYKDKQQAIMAIKNDLSGPILPTVVRTEPWPISHRMALEVSLGDGLGFDSRKFNGDDGKIDKKDVNGSEIHSNNPAVAQSAPASGIGQGNGLQALTNEASTKRTPVKVDGRGKNAKNSALEKRVIQAEAQIRQLRYTDAKTGEEMKALKARISNLQASRTKEKQLYRNGIEHLKAENAALHHELAKLKSTSPSGSYDITKAE